MLGFKMTHKKGSFIDVFDSVSQQIIHWRKRALSSPTYEKPKDKWL
jgi:hypothetical protein